MLVRISFLFPLISPLSLLSELRHRVLELFCASSGLLHVLGPLQVYKDLHGSQEDEHDARGKRQRSRRAQPEVQKSDEDHEDGLALDAVQEPEVALVYLLWQLAGADLDGFEKEQNGGE